MGHACVDGNEAAASVAYALSELVTLYPITPSSPMGEFADAWASTGRTNLWGMVPRVIQMQSEGGAAGAMHGALQTGSQATTFTSSQGLLLMLPNMFKIAGELTSAVIHVAARTIATHALSIFGDHSDVMAARSTGFAMLCSSSVQEAHDLAAVAHVATLQTRVPFLHFFDGFRTSHEMNRVALLDHEDLRALVDDAGVLAHRERGLTPQAPALRGSTQNPDVFFQSREAANPFYEAIPGAVQEAMDRFAERTGRSYQLVEYNGHPEADRVIVIMGSGAGAVLETVEELNRRGERVGVITLRLYRPFPAAELVAALPMSVRRVAVLDRTKEPGAYGEPLFLDVVATLAEAATNGLRDPGALPRVTGGRYGLSSKEFTPAMVKGVFDELEREAPKPRFTVGIVDDVTHLSLQPDNDFELSKPEGDVAAVFYGLGSDGTVGANKNTVKIVSEQSDLHAQGYFVYDSKKAGAMTTSHLRFSRQPIRSTYLVEKADLVACHQFGFLFTQDVLGRGQAGRDCAAQRAVSPRRGVGHAAGAGSAVHRGQAAEGPCHRRAPAGRRDRPPWAHQHRHAAVLLRSLGHPAPGPGHCCGQGRGGEAATAGAGARLSSSNLTAVDRSLAEMHQLTVPDRRDLDHASARGNPCRGTGFRHQGYGAHPCRRGPPASGERAPCGRNLPDRNNTSMRSGRSPQQHPDLGRRHLHRLRQVRHRVPAQRHRDEGPSAGRPGRCAGHAL